MKPKTAGIGCLVILAWFALFQIGSALLTRQSLIVAREACDVIEAGAGQIGGGFYKLFDEDMPEQQLPTTAAECREVVDAQAPVSYASGVFGAVIFAIAVGMFGVVFVFLGLLVFSQVDWGPEVNMRPDKTK